MSHTHSIVSHRHTTSNSIHCNIFVNTVHTGKVPGKQYVLVCTKYILYENSTYLVRTWVEKYVLCLYEYILIQIQPTLHFRHHHHWCKWAWLGSCVSQCFHQCTPQLLGELFHLQPRSMLIMFRSNMYLVCTKYVLVCTHHETARTSIGKSEMKLQHLPHPKHPLT